MFAEFIPKNSTDSDSVKQPQRQNSTTEPSGIGRAGKILSAVLVRVTNTIYNSYIITHNH